MDKIMTKSVYIFSLANCNCTQLKNCNKQSDTYITEGVQWSSG